jgi:hypothetical protein
MDVLSSSDCVIERACVARVCTWKAAMLCTSTNMSMRLHLPATSRNTNNRPRPAPDITEPGANQHQPSVISFRYLWCAAV